jgi:hypothetical protein
MGPTGPQGVQGVKGDKGDRGLTGLSAYQVAQLDGFEGTESEWLETLVGPQGAQGEPGASSGQVYYMDTVGGTYTGTPLSGSITKEPVTGTKTTITGNVSNGTHLVGSFLTEVGAITDLTIDPGFWLLHTYGYAEQDVYHFYKLYIVDANGTSNKTLVSEGSPANATALSLTQALNSYINYVPAGVIPDLTKRGIIDLYIYTTKNNKNFTLEFRGNTFSHLHTTLEVEPVIGPEGPAGPQGETGPTGPQGIQGVKGEDGQPYGNIDGGTPFSIYGGTMTLDGGSV